jgi:diguanylate cyclase (GGDEF)-like protein
MQVLLIDDDSVDREIVKRALKNNPDIGVIQEAKSAKEGLLALSQQKFDILLVDYRMPETDGIELIIELRSRADLNDTAIVMISTSEDENLAISCLQAGAQDFIPKDEISPARLKRAMVQAQTRFELERKLYDSFLQVRELAEKDTLTGLSNRYHFEDALKISIANNKRSKNIIALLLLDLDHFKNINDTYGHETGDKLLKYVVHRINQCLRDNELFARLGGDEFAILVTGLYVAHDATLIAKRIITALEIPIKIDGRDLQCGVSIGIALHPSNADTAESLTKYADIAMYRAKKQGRNQLCYFETSMQEQFSRHYQIESELKLATEKGDFTLHYQPVINSVSKKIVGFEALIRWPNCSLKSTPDEFIPIAEQSRLIDKIGDWVLDTAIKQLSVWHKNYDASLTMAINLSAVQLANVTLVDTIRSIMHKYAVQPSGLVLELTETALLGEDDINQQHINQLHELGCKLALDDFGTGFSSLSHLVNFPITTVKLDKSLLPTSLDDTKHLAIVKGIAAMINIIGLSSVAEGIETEFQLSLCEDLAINDLQGYYFAKPMPAIDIEENWL